MTISVSQTETRCELALPRQRLALAVADVSWFNTENLFREVPFEAAATLSLKCMDYLNAWRKGQPPWAWGRKTVSNAPGHWQRELILPSGWMKRFPKIGMRPIARAIRRWKAKHVPDSRLALVITYPHYLYLCDMVRPDFLIYYNIDDYLLYWPGNADEVRRLEHKAVREADVTVCVSLLRANELREAVPEAAGKIHHLPHGSPTNALAPHSVERPGPAPQDIAHLPRPFLGYVGNLEDRVDWELVLRVAESLPHASIILVGQHGDAADAKWSQARRRCLDLPNVHALGWRPQESIHAYNQSFDICMIPYQVDHPFNRACSPTKIMDCMATGRPIVTTALPECRLYEHLIRVVGSPDEFVEAVESIVAAGSDDGHARERFDWALDHTCRRVSERLLALLPDRST